MPSGHEHAAPDYGRFLSDPDDHQLQLLGGGQPPLQALARTAPARVQKTETFGEGFGLGRKTQAG
jgi:hypothetical protein